MEQITRQCIGIDCGMNEHVLCLSKMHSDNRIEVVSTVTIRNTNSGFGKLVKWIKKFADLSLSPHFVMESTGVYHESLACFLVDRGWLVSVVLPNRAKYFAKTLKFKTSTDKVSAQILATMGLEKKLDLWSKPDPLYNELRQLTRERDQLVHERTQIKSQIHAEKNSAWPNKSSLTRMNHRVRLLTQQIGQVGTEIDRIVAGNPKLEQTVKRLTSVVGAGKLTVVTILAETNGFNLIRNKKQLVSYAGLDVVERTSGISVRGKSRISHKGNKYLRKCLHFPALTAIRHSKLHKNIFARLVGKHGIKMKAAVAIQRKILVLIYSIWKNGTEYDPNFKSPNLKNELGQPKGSALTELA